MANDEVKDLYHFVPRYKRRKEQIRTITHLHLKDNKKLKLNLHNRDLALKWIDYKEKQLQNANGYNYNAELRYVKTLYKEMTTYMTNLMYWFNDKNFEDITAEDIKRIYEGLEKETIKTIKGHSLSEASRKDYYSRCFKSGFFNFIGKDKIAKEIIKRKFNANQEVRFFHIETLKTIVDSKRLKNTHRLAFWLLFDTGIEVSALCQLKKSHFTLEKDDNLPPYYMLHVKNDISKKSRQKRDIYIHHEETNNLLSEYLKGLNDDDYLFNFGPPALYRILKIIVNKGNLKVIPVNKPVIIKDFRSSMATYFIKNGYTTDFIKTRLGHAPSSTEIDRYVNYLGINQKEQKKKAVELDLKNYKEKFNEQEEMLKKIAIENKELKENIMNMNKNYKTDLKEAITEYFIKESTIEFMLKKAKKDKNNTASVGELLRVIKKYKLDDEEEQKKIFRQGLHDIASSMDESIIKGSAYINLKLDPGRKKEEEESKSSDKEVQEKK